MNAHSQIASAWHHLRIFEQNFAPHFASLRRALQTLRLPTLSHRLRVALRQTASNPLAARGITAFPPTTLCRPAGLDRAQQRRYRADERPLTVLPIADTPLLCLIEK